MVLRNGTCDSTPHTVCQERPQAAVGRRVSARPVPCNARTCPASVAKRTAGRFLRLEWSGCAGQAGSRSSRRLPARHDPLLDREQFNVEDQLRVRRDHARHATIPIGEMRADMEPTTPADAHSRNAL